jgi:hypothetical protein
MKGLNFGALYSYEKGEMMMCHRPSSRLVIGGQDCELRPEPWYLFIIIYLLQMGLHPVAVVLTLHSYNKIHTIRTSTLNRIPYLTYKE